MRLPFNGNPRITQVFGNAHFSKDASGKIINPYAQFGILGHNGIDYGMPTGEEVLASHAGTVLEVADEGRAGYGRYVKIENDKEGSLYAHLHNFAVKVGEQVQEGQVLGLSNNTGNSTGPHLHFGYYLKPRNRSNGYAGYIDPQPHFGKGGATMYIEPKVFEELVTKSTKYDELVKEHEQTKHLLSENERVNREKDVIIEDMNIRIASLEEQLENTTATDTHTTEVDAPEVPTEAQTGLIRGLLETIISLLGGRGSK